MVKIKRTFPAPKSLALEYKKVNGSYSEPDVVAQLLHDFHEKCYICELKELQDPQVEHLLPHKNGKYKERKFDWENLFLSCGHCNGVKNKEKYDEVILDCCKRDPEEVIEFRLEENNVCIQSKDSSDLKSVRTAELVQEVFNVCDTGMRIYKSKKRLEKLQEEMNVLYTKLDSYKKQPNSKVTLRTLKALLKRESQFAAFKRNYVREHLDKFPKLKEYVED